MNGYMNPAELANIFKSERDLWWYRGMRRMFFRIVEPLLEGRRIERALETGCGTGYMAHVLQHERGWNIVPMDVEAAGVRYARELGVKNPVQADALTLPFRSGAFDLLLALDMLAHLDAQEGQRAAREWARVLKPGGLVVVRTAALSILRNRHSQFVHERQRYTRGPLEEVFQLAGFRILRSTYANSLLLPVALFKFCVWEPLLRRPPASGVETVAPWLDRLLYAPLALEAAWIGSGGSFPIGQSLLLIGEKMV